MVDFVAYYSDTIERLVNMNLVNARRNMDINMVEFVDDLCKEIAKKLRDHVVYDGFEPSDNLNQIREMNKAKSKFKKSFNGQIYSTEETYSRAYKFKFKLSYDGSISKVDMLIYIPLISDDGVNYLIKGNKYCVPFQMVDAVTFNRTDPKGKYDEVILRTATQPIQMQRYKSTIRDVKGVIYNVNSFVIKLHSKLKNVPFLLFYFATFGFHTTMKYFGLYLRVITELPEPDDTIYNDYLFFKFGSLYILVRKYIFENSVHTRDLVATILLMDKRTINETNISDVNFWIYNLGFMLDKTNCLTKGAGIRFTFMSALDPRTSDIIKSFIGKENINSTYDVVRWMFFNYSTNVSKDVSLVNKRLRLSEYIIEPLKSELKNKANRFTKIRGSYKDIKALENVFRPSPSIILDAINGKTSGLNIGKFTSNVNDLSLMHAITKTTQIGPGAPGSGKSSFLPREFKRLHHSMTGRTDLISTSVNSPGVTLNILPNCNIDPDTLGFNKIISLDD